MLLDRSILKGQKLLKNAKIKNFKYDILNNFRTFFFEKSISSRPKKSVVERPLKLSMFFLANERQDGCYDNVSNRKRLMKVF